MASGPITSWEIDGKTVETVSDFSFFGSKVTADGDCSHEIKRCLLLQRKVMTNLDSILKSRNITLPTMVHLVKAMVTYGCESWTIKKAEHWRIDAFELWCWRLLRVPWTARRSNQSILKISPGCFFGRTDAKLKLQYFGHLMWRVDSLEKTDAGRDWGQEEKGTTEDEMAGWHHRLDGHGFGWTPGVGDGQGGLVCCGSWGCKESDTTERLNWTELNIPLYMCTTAFLSTRLSIDILIASMSWLLWTVLRWTLGYMCVFQFWFRCVCPVVGLLGHMVVLFLDFYGTSILFSIVVFINLHSHQQCRSVSFSPHPI